MSISACHMQRSGGGGNAGTAFQSKLEAYKKRVLGTSVELVGNKRKRNRQPVVPEPQRKTTKRDSVIQDPSTIYLKNPTKAPVCHEAMQFMKRNGFDKYFKICLGEKTGWRTTAKLSVRGIKPQIGLFAPGSHDVIPMVESETHHPSINQVMSQVVAGVEELQIPGYDGENPGGLSYICCNVALSDEKVQLVCVFNADFGDPTSLGYTQKLAEYLQARQCKLHSLWLHCNPASKHNNAIYSYDKLAWKLICGSEYIQDVLTKVRMAHAIRPVLYFPPYVFRQANIMQFSCIISQIRKWVIPNCKLVELYGGVGTIGMHLLDLVSSLHCSDENPNNEKCFHKTRATIPKNFQGRAHYEPLGASKVVIGGGLAHADMLLVDPPRKGLDKEVLEGIQNAPNIQRIVYVSCGFKAFTNDAAAIQSYGYDIVHAEGHLLFPGSNHIETLAVFERQNYSNKSK